MLKLVPPSEPSPKEKVLRRVRVMANDRAEWQCARCGCRSLVSIINGASIVKGRIKGTEIVKHECLQCWKDGIYSPMLTELKTVK